LTNLKLKSLLKFCFKFSFLVISFTSCLYVNAQKEFSKWYFGDKAAIDFSSGTATVLSNSKINGLDNTCSIADSAGNLLYYFDGLNIYNKNHQVMSNGSGLGTDASSGHVAVTIRRPGTGKIYYIFTVEGYAKSNGLQYTLVDMSKNSGLGDVISKNNSLKTPISEKIILAKNANKKDIWLITHKYNSNEWDCYPITSSGIGTPVISAIGSNLDNSSTENVMGNMDITLSYNKVVNALYNQGKMEIFDFNNSTGKLSNLISLTGLTRAWGVQFSPNGSKLYLTQWTTDKLWQYDLTNYNKTDIENSKTSIGPCTGPDASYKAGYLMLAPDNKIYIGKYLSSYLGVINNPDASGSSCNFVDDGLKISPGVSRVGLPNKTFDVISCSINKPYLGRDTAICKGQTLILKDTVKNVSTYLWSDNSTKSSLTISQSGQYWVEIGNGDCKKRDTINVIVKNSPKVSLGNDTLLCNQTQYLLGVNLGGPKYLWNTSETTKTIKTTSSGKYWVEVDSNGCKSSDTIKLNFNNLSKPALGKDTSACEGKTISLIGVSANAKSYSWNNGPKIPQNDVTTSGTFILTVTDNICTLSDTIRVFFIPYPKVNLGKDTGFCGNFSLTLDAGNPGLSRIWSTNETSQTITVTNLHGTYWVDVSNQGCKTRASIAINKLNGPNVDLGKDSIYCQPISRTLLAQNPGMNYLWSNGSNQASLLVTVEGKYWLRVSDNKGCIHSDTLVLRDSSFNFNLGNDTSVCFGQRVILKGLQKPFIHTWHTGDTGATLSANKSGIYKVLISNGACVMRDSLNLTVFPKIDLDLGRDTSICDDLQESLTLNAPGGFMSYSWLPGGENTQSITINKLGIFSLTVIDNNQCRASDQIEITKFCPLYFWIPTAFNANGEGLNGKFGMSYIGPPLSDFEMLIFNRWGELIFKTNNVNESWDGTFMGRPCQLGMYMCLVQFNSKFGLENKKSTYKGMFLLLR
jgi:gliding motility-associated-like protein